MRTISHAREEKFCGPAPSELEPNRLNLSENQKPPSISLVELTRFGPGSTTLPVHNHCKEIPMKSVIATLLTATALLFSAGSVLAGPVGDIKSTLTSSRQQTMAMLSEDDHSVLEMRYEDVIKSSKHLDALLGAALKNDALRGARPTLGQFKEVWEAFKKTRDEDIVPALMAGSRLKARAMALTSQAPRFKEMNTLLDSLPQ